MKPARDLTSLEVLEMAIKSEIEAAKLYRRIRGMVANRELKSRLSFLEKEEKSHRKLFEAAYARAYPEIDPKMSRKSFVPSVEDAIKSKMTIAELFGIAMDAEKMSEKFYADLSKSSLDIQAASMLSYLANVEHGHFELLRNELELLRRYPDYYQSEFYNFGDGLIHVGP